MELRASLLFSKDHRHRVAEQFRQIRAQTLALCRRLEPEDTVMQSMPVVSPPKWHLAHTTWFFEEFILAPFAPGYRRFHPRYAFLFNSYYKSVGSHLERPRRGSLSRPRLREVLSYRKHVEQELGEWLETCSDADYSQVAHRLEVGLHHEQQHQELLLTDIKHIFWSNPLRPAYHKLLEEAPAAAVGSLGASAGASGGSRDVSKEWVEFPGGVRAIGYLGDAFSYDHERPRHRVFLEDFKLQAGLVTNRDYLEFMEDGGYSRSELWLSEGWDLIQSQGWMAPLYWEKIGAQWWVMTLGGMQQVDPDEPVVHVSYFEAEAFARWKRRRLPLEAEWEVAGTALLQHHGKIHGNFLETGRLQPAPLDRETVAGTGEGIHQLWGDVWEWTSSAYLPYPGFVPDPGSLGEYNGKFMCNQMVLRGGSCATPKSHLRVTYRNYFSPETRWQFSGIRLAS